MEPSELLEQMSLGTPPVILDVRTRAEFVAGHIPGSIHIPFWAMPWRTSDVSTTLDTPIVVYCGHGPRALFARSVLRRHGFTQVACLAGHMSAWRQAGRPQQR